MFEIRWGLLDDNSENIITQGFLMKRNKIGTSVQCSQEGISVHCLHQ